MTEKHRAGSMADQWTVERTHRPASVREFRETYLGEFPLRTGPQEEADRRLKLRGREIVLRDLCHEIARETDPARLEHLRSVRLAVVER